MEIFIDNTSESMVGRSPKNRSFTFYLDAIKRLDMGREFKSLEATCTDGDIKPPYPYQWRAVSTTIPGDDDPFEGIAGTPLEALHDLYMYMKDFKNNPSETEDNQPL